MKTIDYNKQKFPQDSIFGLCQKHRISIEKRNGLFVISQDGFEVMMHQQTNFGNALRVIVDKFCLGESEYERLMYCKLDNEQLKLF
jgi:hypothetical protein